MENRSGEQLQPLTTIPNLLPIGQQDPLTLIPLQPNPTLAPLNLANPTDQQILSIITGDNPDGAFQTVAKYSSNPLSPNLSSQTPLYPSPFTLSPLPFPPSPTSLLENTSNSLTLEQLSRVESTAVNIWQNLLPDRRQLDVNFQITDLANGEIAQAQVTKFSPTGLPIGGTILIDRHAQGAGWFVDSTPLDWNEFTPFTPSPFPLTPYLQAKPDSAAAGKYDLFTALLHELGHISGFGHGDTTFDDRAVALSSDKNHLDGGLYAHDLMASGLELGERRLPSALDVTLAASPIVSAAYTAPLLGVGITNGDFSIASNRDANYTWQTNGATNISNGVATLSDTSKQLANLTQKFLIPTNANTLQFTIKNSQLRSGQTNSIPNDSFEVALLDAQMNPLAGKAQGLANTDSLLNLQADGTVYFSDKVKIGGVTTSGGKIANTDERTVTIDLAGIAGNTEAMLYFDLLSFGSGESNVTIDNVKIFTQAAPQLQNANLATNQATGLDIPLPNGVTFNSIELGTQPQHGTVVRNPLDGKITYTPKSDYVGTDSFTYLGFSPDGQISNPATINITVNNVAPKIDSVVIPPTAKEGQNVQLQATASDGGSSNNLTYSWNLGDGSNPMVGQNIAHTFADNGTYNVTLTVTDKDGGISQQTTQVLVDNVAPTVNITAPVNTIDQGGSVQFGVNYSDAGIQDTHTITWNFGDGSTPVTGVTNPNHLFTTVGDRNVTVTVTDNDGASTTQSLKIAVNNVAPTINSIDIPTNINEGQLVQLTATASDPGNDALTYNWHVNNATTPIVGQTINYTFADNGIYPVKLNVIDSNGAIITQSVEVAVNNVAPIIVAIVKPDKISEGELVEFRAVATDVGINDNLTYTWNFGDNTSLVSGQKVNHVFTDNGNYNITLTVKDKDGATTTQTTSVKVDNVAPIIVSIFKPELIKEGQQIEFQATATDVGLNDSLTYNWNFGDNTNIVVGQNATHSFADNGNYDVTLTVTDKDGGVTTQSVVAKVDNVAPTIVSITKPTIINEGQSVTFAATATDPGILDTLTYSWNFGDSTNPVLGQNVNHTFVDNGNYDVVLTVTDKDGAVTNQTVAVTVDNVAPVVVSIDKPNQIKEGELITFSATATDQGILDTLTYSWNFGDNTDSVIGQDVNHIFADNGNYNVTLTVTDKDSGVITKSVAVTVDNVAPTVVSILKPSTIKEGESVTFSATASDPGILDTLTYVWNFGDNTTAVSGQNATHIFADNGNYNVVLTITDKDGGVTTQTVVAKVDNVAPTVVSISKPNIIKEGESVIFAATVTDPGILDTLTYNWNFGDNTNAVSGQNVTHTFADNGNYNVVLTVKDKDGAVTTQTVVVKVDNVAASITNITLPQNVVAGTVAQFAATATDTGIQDTLTYTWNFGDNTTTIIGQNTTHTFTTAGTYTVILTVTDKDGAITTQTQSLTVIAPPSTGGSGIRAGGDITINGSANFDGNTTNRTDDTQIYAGKSLKLNGNITLPVKRDAAGNPIKLNGKIVLVDNQITLGTGATTSSNPNQYTNITTATQTITIPTYANIKLQEFTPPISAVIKTFNIQTTPIRNSADWNTKFPPAGTATNPTVVRIINGNLDLPANINLSNYILIVENGNINFSQGNPVLNNVKLIANNGNINLNSTTGTNLSLSASGNINITGNTKLGGTSILNSNGNITTNGGLSMVNTTATVKMIAQGDLNVNGNTSLKGQLFAKKNVTINGQTTLVGSIDALLNVSIGGNSTITAG